MHAPGAEAVADPRAGQWNASTINGNRTRGTGILNNELYIGRLVWNRLAYVKDPETGRRRSRQRSTETLVTTQVPDLRIVDQDLWDRVKARQAVLDAKGAAPRTEAAPSGRSSARAGATGWRPKCLTTCDTG